MRFARSRLDAEMLEQRFADQMRRLARRVADADVHAGLAKVHRQQLRMDVGEVQQAQLAERRVVVEARARRQIERRA